MYGTRPAAQNWQNEVIDTVTSIGFEVGKASPCVFYHKERDIMTYIHGDDFLSSGEEAALKWLQESLEKKYSISTKVIGEARHLDKSLRVLNRILKWTPTLSCNLECTSRPERKVRGWADNLVC